jgi:copper chaperone
MKKDIYKVNGMTCAHCVNRVQKNVMAISGIENAKVNLAKGELEVEYNNEVSKETIKNVVDDLGYELV